jgi:hypothetical protein
VDAAGAFVASVSSAGPPPLAWCIPGPAALDSACLPSSSSQRDERCGAGAMLRRWGGTLSQVPRSSKLVAEDSDYALFSTVLFRRVADEFKAAARQRGYQASGACGAHSARARLVLGHCLPLGLGGHAAWGLPGARRLTHCALLGPGAGVVGVAPSCSSRGRGHQLRWCAPTTMQPCCALALAALHALTACQPCPAGCWPRSRGMLCPTGARVRAPARERSRDKPVSGPAQGRG